MHFKILVDNAIKTLRLLSYNEEVLSATESALLGKCADLHVRFLFNLATSEVGQIILRNIASQCIWEMEGFIGGYTYDGVDLSQVVPYLNDAVFAEHISGISRATLEAATPQQVALMNPLNCLSLHVEGLREESQMSLTPLCFVIALKSHLSSISSLSPNVIKRFMRYKEVVYAIPVDILQYSISPRVWDLIDKGWVSELKGFATQDWSNFINEYLPDDILNQIILKAHENVKKRTVKEIARRYLNTENPDLSKLRNIEARDEEKGFIAFKLDSGARLFIHNSSNDAEESFETVMHIQINAGSDQDGSVAGLAHLAEHLVFNCPTKFGLHEESIMFHYKRLGKPGSANARTLKMKTFFKFKVQDSFGELFGVANAFSNPSISKPMVQAESKVIESEYLLRLIKLSHSIFNEAFPHFHPDNPARNFSAGNLQSLKRDDILDKVKEFFHRNYCAGNMEIYLSSPLPEDMMALMMQNFFAGLPQCEGTVHDGKQQPNKIWASQPGDVLQVYSKTDRKKDQTCNIYALPCTEEQFICDEALASFSQRLDSFVGSLASGGIYYVVQSTEVNANITPVIFDDPFIHKLRGMLLKSQYDQKEIDIRRIRVEIGWHHLINNPDAMRSYNKTTFSKSLQGSLMQNPYYPNVAYSWEAPSSDINKNSSENKAWNGSISLLYDFEQSEKDYFKLVLLKTAQKMKILDLRLLIYLTNNRVLLFYPFKDQDDLEKAMEYLASLLRAKNDELRQCFSEAALKFNNHQRILSVSISDSHDYLNKLIGTLIGIETGNNKNLTEDIGFPLQPDQYSCISEWEVSEVLITIKINSVDEKVKEEMITKYFPPITRRSFRPVLPKAGETFYLASESPFMDNAVVVSFILDSTDERNHFFGVLSLNALLYKFFRHDKNISYVYSADSSEKDLRLSVQSYKDPHHLYVLLQEFFENLPSIAASFGKYGIILAELWSTRKDNWKQRKSDHLEYLKAEKGDGLKVYHNFCDYPKLEEN